MAEEGQRRVEGLMSWCFSKKDGVREMFMYGRSGAYLYSGLLIRAWALNGIYYFLYSGLDRLRHFKFLGLLSILLQRRGPMV